MSSDAKIILYDISSKLNPQAWSFNTWKVRLVLNYKRIPYKTIWLSFPDIKPTLEGIGSEPTDPNPDGGLLYTLPTIVDTSSGSPIVVTDSLAITEYLDKTYPERPVFPKDTGKALICAFEEAFVRIVAPHARELVVPAVWKILDERSQPYLRETRERWFGRGKKLEEWCPEGPGREAAWKALERAWDKVAKILDKNGPGVDWVAGGSHPTRADFFVVSYLAGIVAVFPEEWDGRIRLWSGGRWEKLWKLTEEFRAVH